MSRITQPVGINHELFPFMRMTVPRSFRGKTIEDFAPGSFVGRSWLLLFGVLPIDHDDITLAARESGRYFREESTMMSMRSWTHERTLREVPEGCEVTDRLSYELRLPFQPVAWLIRGGLGLLFRHRHRRLAAWSASRNAK